MYNQAQLTELACICLFESHCVALAHLALNVDRATHELSVVLQRLPPWCWEYRQVTTTTCLALAFKNQCFYSV